MSRSLPGTPLSILVCLVVGATCCWIILEFYLNPVRPTTWPAPTAAQHDESLCFGAVAGWWLVFKIRNFGGDILLDYNKVHPKGELAIIWFHSNRLRWYKSFVLESAFLFRDLVGHGAHYTVILLAIPLCSWTYILCFYLFGRIVKECHPPVIKEMRSARRWCQQWWHWLLFPATIRVVMNKNDKYSLP
jgi:hypothetical protein